MSPVDAIPAEEAYSVPCRVALVFATLVALKVSAPAVVNDVVELCTLGEAAAVPNLIADVFRRAVLDWAFA